MRRRYPPRSKFCGSNLWVEPHHRQAGYGAPEPLNALPETLFKAPVTPSKDYHTRESRILRLPRVAGPGGEAGGPDGRAPQQNPRKSGYLVSKLGWGGCGAPELQPALPHCWPSFRSLTLRQFLSIPPSEPQLRWNRKWFVSSIHRLQTIQKTTPGTLLGVGRVPYGLNSPWRMQILSF